jgi:hypothetical protein
MSNKHSEVKHFAVNLYYVSSITQTVITCAHWTRLYREIARKQIAKHTGQIHTSDWLF